LTWVTRRVPLVKQELLTLWSTWLHSRLFLGSYNSTFLFFELRHLVTSLVFSYFTHTIYGTKMLITTAKPVRKGNKRLTPLPVSNDHTNNCYILQSCTYIVHNFPHKNDVRFVFSSGFCRRVHVLFTLFVFVCLSWRLVSYVPDVANFSGLSIIDCLSGFL
jgi:hypothetical protein